MYGLGYLSTRSGFSMAPFVEENKSHFTVISLANSKDRHAQSVDQLQYYKITEIVHAISLVKNPWCNIPVN